MPTPAHIRVLNKTEMDENGCLVFKGALSKGYGRISVWQGEYGKRYMRVYQSHRIVYEALVGPIPDDMTIDHTCQNRACQNIDHMEVVTRGENTRRAALGRFVSHCKRGHAYEGYNIYVSPKGKRFCRKCLAIHGAKWHQKNKHKKSLSLYDEGSLKDVVGMTLDREEQK